MSPTSWFLRADRGESLESEPEGQTPQVVICGLLEKLKIIAYAQNPPAIYRSELECGSLHVLSPSSFAVLELV